MVDYRQLGELSRPALEGTGADEKLCGVGLT